MLVKDTNNQDTHGYENNRKFNYNNLKKPFMELFYIIFVSLILVIIGIVVLYRHKLERIESIIEKRFYDVRQITLIDDAKKIQSMESTIEFLTDTKNTIQLQLEQERLHTITSNKKSLALGQNIIKGEIVQILASFSILTEYDNVALVSSVSRHASFDMIGVNNDRIDFIEVKAGNTPLTHNESNIKELIESGKVHYRIIEGNLSNIALQERADNQYT